MLCIFHYIFHLPKHQDELPVCEILFSHKPQSDCLCRGRSCAISKVRTNQFVFFVARLLWTTWDEVRPHSGLPGHGLQHLQDSEHGHVYLGARKGSLGQAGQGQRLDSRTQWPVTVATGKSLSKLNLLSVVITVEILSIYSIIRKWTADCQALADNWLSLCWRISSYLPGIVIDGEYTVMHANGFNYIS